MAKQPSHIHNTGRFTHPLAYARHVRGWTQVDLARRLARRVGGQARGEQVSRWENDNVEPALVTQYALAEELGVPVDRVRRDLWPKWLPVGEQFVVDRVWTSESCFVLLDSTAGEILRDRRGFVTLAAGSAMVLVEQWRGTVPLPCLLVGTAEDLVGSVESRLQHLRGMEDRYGGGRVRGLVDIELRFITELLRESAFGGAEARRLFRLAADLCRIAGWASTDNGYLSSSAQYFTLGLRAARAGGDPLAGANLLKCMSLLLAEDGRPKEALALARSAVKGTQNAPSRVRAMLTVRQARLHAVLGERSDCERQLALSEELMGQDDDRPCPAWADYFDTAEYTAQVAACYLALGSHRVSDEWLEKTLVLQPASRERDGITYRLWRAENAAHLGDVEAACHHLSGVAPVVQQGFSERNRVRFRSVRGLLDAHHTLAPVRDLDEQVTALLA
ncbi:helix-turn-helix transcriptional regulator [Streptomyces sp. NPDC055036]